MRHDLSKLSKLLMEGMAVDKHLEHKGLPDKAEAAQRQYVKPAVEVVKLESVVCGFGPNSGDTFNSTHA